MGDHDFTGSAWVVASSVKGIGCGLVFALGVLLVLRGTLLRSLQGSGKGVESFFAHGVICESHVKM